MEYTFFSSAYGKSLTIYQSDWGNVKGHQQRIGDEDTDEIMGWAIPQVTFGSAIAENNGTEGGTLE